MARVLSVSSSRADVGILAPIWRALAAAPGVELHLWATGMHLAPGAPPLSDAPAEAAVHRGGADLGGGGPGEAAAAMAAIAAAAGALFADVRPDVVLITGDRLDMLPAAAAAVPFNLPLVHLHGGEVTEGALDDRARHAMTRLAHLHCVSTERARQRLIGWGEEPWRIHVTGAPGIDTLLAAPVMPRRAFLDAIGFESVADDAPLRLVTVHPETNATDPAAPLKAVLAALETRSQATLFTAPNRDPGGAAIRSRIEAFVARHDWARFRDTLGSRLYPNALRHAQLMLGNSSSGIIEAGPFGLPVIDVGDRQRGRERGANVESVPADAAAVGAALDCLAAAPVRRPPDSPYGDGRAGARVAQVLIDLPPAGTLLHKRLIAVA